MNKAFIESKQCLPVKLGDPYPSTKTNPLTSFLLINFNLKNAFRILLE